MPPRECAHRLSIPLNSSLRGRTAIGFVGVPGKLLWHLTLLVLINNITYTLIHIFEKTNFIIDETVSIILLRVCVISKYHFFGGWKQVYWSK